MFAINRCVQLRSAKQYVLYILRLQSDQSNIIENVLSQVGTSLRDIDKKTRIHMFMNCHFSVQMTIGVEIISQNCPLFPTRESEHPFN